MTPEPVDFSTMPIGKVGFIACPKIYVSKLAEDISKAAFHLGIELSIVTADNGIQYRRVK